MGFPQSPGDSIPQLLPELLTPQTPTAAHDRPLRSVRLLRSTPLHLALKYEHKKAKTNPMVATKALASKLSKAGWHVMSQNEPYDPQRVFPFLRQPAAKKAN